MFTDSRYVFRDVCVLVSADACFALSQLAAEDAHEMAQGDTRPRPSLPLSLALSRSLSFARSLASAFSLSPPSLPVLSHIHAYMPFILAVTQPTRPPLSLFSHTLPLPTSLPPSVLYNSHIPIRILLIKQCIVIMYARKRTSNLMKGTDRYWSSAAYEALSYLCMRP
jgi:hypothetical protein